MVNRWYTPLSGAQHQRIKLDQCLEQWTTESVLAVTDKTIGK